MLPPQAQREAHRRRALQLADALPADAVLSHESAAIVWGLPTHTVPHAVHVTRPRGKPVRTSDVAVYVTQLRSCDRAIADGRPVTSLARTAVDLGRHRPFLAALITADAALRRGATREQMQSVLRHQWTWPRIRHAMAVVREADRRSESALESWVRGRCILLDLPRPDLQRWIGDEVEPLARVDFYWEDYALVGEADGRVKYAGNQADDDALIREKDREEILRDGGVEVIRWRWKQARAPDAEFRSRLEGAMRRGLVGRVARNLVAQACPGTNVIDIARLKALGLT
jgi:very-short-patch-repair endonuclease